MRACSSAPSGTSSGNGVETKGRRYYISVEVAYFDHPKVKAAGERLAYRNLKAQAWCHQYRTDGVLPWASAIALAGGLRWVNELVAHGLWEVCGDGWKIHDYLEHQQSKATLDEASEVGRRSVARRRDRGGTPNS